MPRRATSTSYGREKGNVQGVGNHKSGDLPQTFKKRLQILATRARTIATVEAILDDAEHPQFGKVWVEAMDRGFGKIPQPVNVGGAGGGPVEVLFRHEGKA